MYSQGLKTPTHKKLKMGYTSDNMTPKEAQRLYSRIRQ
ncbi:hypothetical protein GAPWKB11_0757 [Gilliamella apicola]|nr:hypothetical protein GAPWKB11_0757 [Gilliamella apicola]